MGACASTPDRAGEERSAAIDRVIEEDSKRLRKECKILLLGSGESGKSTIVKQMKIIHKNGYTTDERLAFVHNVYKNLLDSAKDIINALAKYSLEAVHARNRGNIDRIYRYHLEFVSTDGGRSGGDAGAGAGGSGSDGHGHARDREVNLSDPLGAGVEFGDMGSTLASTSGAGSGSGSGSRTAVSASGMLGASSSSAASTSAHPSTSAMPSSPSLANLPALPDAALPLPSLPLPALPALPDAVHIVSSAAQARSNAIPVPADARQMSTKNGGRGEAGTWVFDEEVAGMIYDLWRDPVIAQLMEHSSDFYLMDSAGYFFSEAKRIGAEGFVPTEMDILRARVKTTAIQETRFNMDQLNIHMFDVGGQRSERKKWIHCFESVTSIIFCTALSEYDQILLEERNQNRMVESLVLFESVINSRWFLRTSIVLFLNKIDVFKAKLPKIPLERYFPEYTGGADINKAAKYILWRFMLANRAKLSVYPHLTQATDTGNIRLVFAAVKDTILQNALKDSGIL